MSEIENETAELGGTTKSRTSLSVLLLKQLSGMENARVKLFVVTEPPAADDFSNVPLTRLSTGGRPVFGIRKEHIKHLRDASMN